MCAVDDAEPWDFSTTSTQRARKLWRCTECARQIKIKEEYVLTKGMADGHWSHYRHCQHCLAAGEWMVAVCNGWIFGGLCEEMVEHWYDGFTSVPFGRLIAGVKHGWHDGQDPIPDKASVRQLATEMCLAQVAPVRAVNFGGSNG